MAILERVYNVPLRNGYMKAPMYRRTKKAVNTLRTFVAKNMKVSEKKVKLGKYVNLEMWKHGIKNPPHHIKVNVKKDDEGNVFAELVGAPVEKTPAVTSKKATGVEEAKAALAGEGNEIKDAEIVEETKFDDSITPVGYQTESINKAYISKKPSALESAAGFGEEKAETKAPKSSAPKKAKKAEKSE
ncbi:TPA: 50S ribosomal protein L31e [Candidatus Woesearchaeota archaeon]|nr:50S ribosomal protein L31e [Candidatus Woesearchaeota archaeon]